MKWQSVSSDELELLTPNVLFETESINGIMRAITFIDGDGNKLRLESSTTICILIPEETPELTFDRLKELNEVMTRDEQVLIEPMPEAIERPEDIG